MKILKINHKEIKLQERLITTTEGNTQKKTQHFIRNEDKSYFVLDINL